MPLQQDIKLILRIKDKNIILTENCTCEELHKGIHCMIISAKLTHHPIHCECCGIIFDSNIQLNISPSGLKTLLELHKQRYLCRHCILSNSLKITLFSNATKKRSEVEIAHDNFVSHSTSNLYFRLSKNIHYLFN